MTNQAIPADKVREIVDAMRESMRRAENTCSDVGLLDDMSVYITDLVALLPTPPLPTLADMTEEERKACQWMQADVANHSVRYVLANPCDGDGEAALVAADGKIRWTFPGYVTPRPDLPRMEWPGDKKPAPALPDGWRLADHKEYGRVVVTNTTPDADGHVYFVLPDDDLMGYDWHFCRPDALTYIDTDNDTITHQEEE